ncbi:aminopeptidase [Acutalibacter sp. 1XD8-36]|uniref:aminopeptidase n=1 Tax=Acutalibacter sp. 1XD8-36 TaxID=2320852 RepID=UPI001411B2C6|nr:aminopeptidase [Acutalibacter sp. 1XD8-36]NBJ88409.1 aminopeptidase [Acutalibacter sp. 1XD8-36]
MDLEKMKRKYAYTLARVGLNVQKGQTVLVEAAVEGWEFTSIFAEECYKLGAGNVVVHYLDLPNMKVAAKYRPDSDMRRVEDWEYAMHQGYLDGGACYVRLEGVNPKLMEDVSETNSNAIFSHVDTVRNIMRKASREKHCQWLIAMIPTVQWAEYILDKTGDEALNELWEILLKLCYIDEDNDVVKTWEEKGRRNAERGRAVDALKLTKLHYTASNGTDLTVGLTPWSKFGYDGSQPQVVFNANIPSEEIFTTPDKFGTNGVVYASRPLLLGGKSIENFGFRFENGKVVEVLAGEGKEMLEALINTDENAGYLGEAALVEYHSPISMSGLVYYTTLIDENASCHLALGRGLGGQREEFNDSTIHVDFMIGTPDMRIVGTTEDGREVDIFRDGDFAI